jgi:hypothetical protein
MAAQRVASRAVLSSIELVSGGRSVGVVRLRTKGHGDDFFLRHRKHTYGPPGPVTAIALRLYM